MRISDWSSDVCSSDLPGAAGGSVFLALDVCAFAAAPARLAASETRLAGAARELADRRSARRARDRVVQHPALYGAAKHYRSEEHTSELQSLMRISYAVFCLKKKNT